MKKGKFEAAKAGYEFEEDIFSARPIKRKYDSSIQIGNFIFDLNKKGNIIGFEILNASKLFKIPKLFLKSIISGKIEIVVGDKYIQVDINIKSLIRNAHKSSTLNVERVRPEFLSPSELKLEVAAS